MSQIRAVVVDHSAPGNLRLAEVAAPVPGPSQALIRLAATSLNRGETRAARASEPGTQLGWDVAGIVERPAADGSGPQAGARVIGVLPAGAWGELVAVPTQALAEIPEGLSFAQAATLPLAGLTALYALERGGPLLGRKVLITGATGGVGLFASQLARMAGAHVVALVRREEQVAEVRAAGAETVIVSADGEAALEQHAPYDLVVESLGGATLGQAMNQLRYGGVCVSLGVSQSPEATFDVRRFFNQGAWLYGFMIFDELLHRPVADDLALLARLAATDRLQTAIAVEAPWTEIGAVAQQLVDRRFSGKAVLHVTA